MDTATTAWLVWPLVLVNVIAFLLVGSDKSRSRSHETRVPEVYFFFLATFFAAAGVFLGMLVFRHKTQKLYFPVGIGMLLLEQAALVYMAFVLLAQR